MSRWAIPPALLAAGGLALLWGPATARADFTETFCDASPAAPWTEGVEGFAPFSVGADDCTPAGGGLGSYTFYLASETLAAGASASAGIEMPAGEVLTGESLSFGTIPSSGGAATYSVRYDGTQISGGPMPFGSQPLSATLPDATSLDFIIECPSGGSACTFSASNPLTVGAVTLTIHDTGSPTVSAAGGSLAATGTYSGVQTLGYSAEDSGSGVARVSAAIGATEVGTSAVSCQSSELSPCPHSVTGTFTIDTTGLSNGTYPVTLSTADASGDQTTTTVDTITVRNSGTVSVTPRRHPGRMSVRVVTGWQWGHRPYTLVRSLRFAHLPARASILLSCAGRGCPRRSWSSGRQVRRFDRRVVGVRLRAGDRLTFTIRAPDRLPERIRVTIRNGRSPVGRVLASVSSR